MDLWDVAKVMWRRRWVAAPLLLLSLVGAVFALLTVPPDYKVTCQLAVIPASTAGSLAAGSTVNPFTVDSLAELIAVDLNRAEVKRQLEAQGRTPEYEVAADRWNGLTKFAIDVEGKSSAQATTTCAQLTDMVQQEAQQRQERFNLADGAEITVEVIDRGEEITVVRTVGKRTLIVIVGVGVLVTVAVSLWVDALIRRRHLREPPMPPARFAVPMPPAPRSPGPLPPIPNAANASTVPIDSEYADNDSTIVLPLAGVSWSNGGKRKPAEKEPKE